MRERRNAKTRRAGLGLWAGLLLSMPSYGGCGPQAEDREQQPVAQLQLVSSPSPLGLSYGEQTTLQLRYLVRRDPDAAAEPRAGVTLKLTLDSPVGGGTLSTATAVTNDLGEASVRLTAGAVESAFHVTVSAPLSPDLVVDVAVSRFAFGTLRVVLDASPVSLAATQLRAGLYPETSCVDLPPAARLLGALRSQLQNGPRGELLFGTLLLQTYAVVGRGEDQSGRLLGYGCVEVPERLLRADLNIPVDVPLTKVWPSPVGSYALDLKLVPQWAIGVPWTTLTCSRGLGVTLVDAMLAVLGPSDLAMRLLMSRGSMDTRGCRSDTMLARDPDRIVDALLQATTQGPTLATVATEFWPVLREQYIKSKLTVKGSDALGFVGVHSLSSVELKTQTMSQIYSLLGAPVPTASEIVVTQLDDRLTVAPHDLAVRLPKLWQKALSDLVMAPRGVTLTAGQLLTAAVAASRYGTQSGCQALENAICDQYAAPCKGLLLPACQTALTNVSAQLQAVIADPPLGTDLRLGLSAKMNDPDGTITAVSLSDGALSGDATLSSSTVKLGGTLTGLRDSKP